jgi:hypothetical protein
MRLCGYNKKKNALEHFSFYYSRKSILPIMKA